MRRERDVSPSKPSLLSTLRTKSPSRLLILTPDHQHWPLIAGTSINAFTIVLCADVIQMGFVFAKRFVVLVLFASITLTPPSTPSSNPLQGRTEMGCRRFNVAVARSDWCERDCLATRRIGSGWVVGWIFGGFRWGFALWWVGVGYGVALGGGWLSVGL
uniref:Uncharacterized protein n=1 Tax=Fagus sylvatica TaxID=28930 RepID=A0A2N9EG34_FAGSY